MPDYGALAYLNQANTFTEPITVKKDADPLLTLYTASSTGKIRVNLDGNDSLGNQTTYGKFWSDISDATDGTESAFLNFGTMSNGTFKTALDVSPEGEIEFGGTGQYVRMNDTNLTASHLLTFPNIDGRVHIMADRNYFEQQDDFTCGSITNTNTSNQVGILNWGFTTAGTSAPVVTAGVASHPGIVSLVTGSAAGTDNSRLHLTDTASKAFMDPTDMDRVMFIIRIPTITSVSVRVGIGQDISAANFGTAGAWIQFDAAVNAAWQTITRQASTSTTNTSGTTVTASNWYMLEVRYNGTDWEFYINNALAFTHSANKPTTACNVGMIVQNATTASRTLDIDYFHIRTKKLGQRWT